MKGRWYRETQTINIPDKKKECPAGTVDFRGDGESTVTDGERENERKGGTIEGPVMFLSWM